MDEIIRLANEIKSKERDIRSYEGKIKDLDEIEGRDADIIIYNKEYERCYFDIFDINNLNHYLKKGYYNRIEENKSEISDIKNTLKKLINE